MRQIRQSSRLICGCTENFEKPMLRTIYASSVLFLSEDQGQPFSGDHQTDILIYIDSIICNIVIYNDICKRA